MDGSQCIEACLDGTYLSVDEKSCLTACPDGQFVSMDGTRCVMACNSTEVGEFVRLNSNRCVASCGEGNGMYVSHNSNRCVDVCDGDSFVSLNKTWCILASECSKALHMQIIEDECQCI